MLYPWEKIYKVRRIWKQLFLKIFFLWVIMWWTRLITGTTKTLVAISESLRSTHEHVSTWLLATRKAAIAATCPSVHSSKGTLYYFMKKKEKKKKNEWNACKWKRVLFKLDLIVNLFLSIVFTSFLLVVYSFEDNNCEVPPNKFNRFFFFFWEEKLDRIFEAVAWELVDIGIRNVLTFLSDVKLLLQQNKNSIYFPLFSLT